MGHSPPPCPSLRYRFKVERYMQLVFGFSSLMLFVPVLFHKSGLGQEEAAAG